MQVENVDRFWDPSTNKNIGGPRGKRFASRTQHVILWTSMITAYLYFTRHRNAAPTYRAPPPPCEAPTPFREVLGHETTSEQPHLRRLEIENNIPSHVPQKKLGLRDFSIHTNDLKDSGKTNSERRN